MPAKPIQFFNRYSGQIETEAVYGEKALRFAYENPLGRGLLELIVKRAIFSRWYGWRMDRPASRAKVLPFIARYGLDAGEFIEAPESFATFNEFFFRKLRPGARPVDAAEDSLVFPADGRHLGFASARNVQGVFVKGQAWNLPALLGSEELAERYQNGALVLSRLCPVDYHRFHFPCAGTPAAARLISGPLYSVSPVALRRNLGRLWQNKRALTLVETEKLGTVAVVEIGATNVGSINQTFQPGHPVAKGDEKGYFAFGGSSMITLFEEGKVTLAGDLLRESGQLRELYARMGDVMGRRA
jgi:phosphatidylserine decarboxylase